VAAGRDGELANRSLRKDYSRSRIGLYIVPTGLDNTRFVVERWKLALLRDRSILTPTESRPGQSWLTSGGSLCYRC